MTGYPADQQLGPQCRAIDDPAVRAEIRRRVDQAPPLTAEQRDRLAALLRPPKRAVEREGEAVGVRPAGCEAAAYLVVEVPES